MPWCYLKNILLMFHRCSIFYCSIIKGDLARKKTRLFYCLSRKPLWKLSESKKPHSKIFSQSPKKRFFVFAWWRHTGAEGIISLYSIQNGKHINMGFCRFFYQLFTETPIVIVKWTRNPKKMVPSSENKYNMPDDVIN